MDGNASRGCIGFFDAIEDPRVDRTKRHRLDDILTIAILAVICNADGWTQVELFGKSKYQWLDTFLGLPHGIPSHDTFGRVFAQIDPDQFEQCFIRWTNALARATDGELVAIDGKEIRRSLDAANEKVATHMVSAWSESNHLVLGQLATDAKSNEITAIPRLLELMDLADTTVTIDAIGCQKAIVRKIVDGEGDYVIQVKANQGTMHEEIRELFDHSIEQGWAGMDHAFHEETNGGHGRVETRRVWVTGEVDWFQDRDEWAGLRSFACVEAERCENGEPGETERRYYISSRPGDDAPRMLEATRRHWGIENRLHWSLDMNFDEDWSRIRKGNGAENFSRLRRLSLNLLKSESSLKVGIKSKRKHCGWDHDYLLKVVTQK